MVEFLQGFLMLPSSELYMYIREHILSVLAHYPFRLLTSQNPRRKARIGIRPLQITSRLERCLLGLSVARPC